MNWMIKDSDKALANLKAAYDEVVAGAALRVPQKWDKGITDLIAAAKDLRKALNR